MRSLNTQVTFCMSHGKVCFPPSINCFFRRGDNDIQADLVAFLAINTLTRVNLEKNQAHSRGLGLEHPIMSFERKEIKMAAAAFAL